jgi:NRPS condensation-like uncharacterized protein
LWLGRGAAANHVQAHDLQGRNVKDQIAMPSQSLLRPLDPAEAFFFMADRVSCMNFVVFAERVGHLDAERIGRGLAVIQAENSLLHARIVWTEGDGLCFATAPDQSIELACHEVDNNEWPTLIEGELASPFAEAASPLLRCLYIRMSSPARSVLALCFHHSIGDGRCGTEILRRLLDCIASGDSSPRDNGGAVLPPLHEAFPPRFRWAEQEEAAEQLMEQLMTDYKQHGRLTPLPWLASDAPTRRPRFMRLDFAPEITRCLLARCREQGTTLHALICAAQLLAEFPLLGSSDAATLFLSCPVDMRPHLQPMPPSVPAGLYASIISAAFVVGSMTDLWELARAIRAQTTLQLVRGEAHLFFAMYGLSDMPILPERMARFAKTLQSSWKNTMVSNIGPVATIDSDPAVEAVSFALCPMPYQALFNAVSTYRERLILNLAYDAGKLDADSARALAAGMREWLLDAANCA